MDKIFKGEGFLNRYRITGRLVTKSPLHIGTGEQVEKGKPDTVVKDHRGKPYIPGSSIKGVMRHWLLSVLTGVGTEWADQRNYEAPALTELSQEQQLERVKNDFSWLELLFGTPFHEGKVEVWDASCSTKSLKAKDSLLQWNSESLTYVDTSVAIDPTTGTAVEHLLYSVEVVPPGVEFLFTLVAQNLSDIELGLILFALQGFNSEIFPIRIGARSGRGYGRMEFTPGDIYYLDKSKVKDWIKSTVDAFDEIGKEGEGKKDDAAGYFTLPKVSAERRNTLIQQIKTEFRKNLGE